MRIATRPTLVIAAGGLAVAAIAAAMICRPAALAAIPGFVRAGDIGTPDPPAPRFPPPAAPFSPPAIVAPAPPPPIPAFGDARSFAADGEETWLRPGRSIWRPDLARTGPIGILVDLRRQMLYVYRAGTLIGVTTVSTGRRHYETPAGSFPILEKATWHRSTIYSGAPMPYMQRLTWGGVALHAGGVPGYRQSHGCIHLPPGFARSLFKVTSIGAEVRVVRSLPRIDPTMQFAVAAPAASGLPFPTTAQSAAAIIAAAL